MKEVTIQLDDKSIEILKNVEEIHRTSLINVGLALVSKTGFYKTLCNKNESSNLDDILSLDVEQDKGSSTSGTSGSSKVNKAPEKKTTSWDSF